ncbi:hypothetical protein BJX61DRAFT_551444 [Aspergillus egyptiacus]|nr:hypothetical protein BJX61DRAFT_551444 [Aspergillus egyptiacus]
MTSTDDAAVADRGWILHAVSWPLFGACAILITLRLFVRTRILRSCGWDDAFILIAFLCAAVNSALIAVSVQHGTGRYDADLSRSQQILARKYQIISQGFHVMSTNWGKVSVALFLIRIISGVKGHKRMMYSGIVILSIINIVAVVTIYKQCSPTAKAWDPEIEGTCWPVHAQRDYALFQGSASALTDFLLAIYPLFTIKNLQMALKVKIGLGCVLSLGIIAMVAAIVKTIHLPSLSEHANSAWNMVDLTIYVALEQYLIILAACIPALTPLFNIIVRHRSNRSKTKTKTKTGASALFGGTGGGGGHLQYATFASVGRDFVEYPMTWAGGGDDSDRKSLCSRHEEECDVSRNASGNGSEVAFVESGILRTTEFQIKEVSSSGGYG